MGVQISRALALKRGMRGGHLKSNRGKAQLRTGSSSSKTAMALLDAVRQVRDTGWPLGRGGGGNKHGFLQ